ncbi:MAG: hypothetical protein WC554_14525 [Clostridia bacterium]
MKYLNFIDIKMILDFSIPKKVRSTKEHNETYDSDSGIPGTYVPNMSEKDKHRWKAKHVKGDNERIEIRKTFTSQLLIVVYKKPYQPKRPEFPEYDGGGKDFYWEQANKIYSAAMDDYEKSHRDVQMSMNGKLDLTFEEWEEMIEAINEARFILD